MLGSTYEPQYFKNYPCIEVPRYLDDFMIIKMSYYFYETAHLVLFNRDRHDFTEMMVHHIVSVALISITYSMNILPVAPVMLVTDCTDIFVALFKLTIDVNDNL